MQASKTRLGLLNSQLEFAGKERLLTDIDSSLQRRAAIFPRIAARVHLLPKPSAEGRNRFPFRGYPEYNGRSGACCGAWSALAVEGRTQPINPTLTPLTGELRIGVSPWGNLTVDGELKIEALDFM